MKPGLLVVSGASGAGKTAAVLQLVARGLPGVRCYYFDSIGVPTAEEMAREFGGGEAWQADATRRWVARLAAEIAPGEIGVLDGQTRPSFVRAALAGYPDLVVGIVLFDCAPGVRAARLAGRGQPELHTPAMDTWAAYLRGQADALGLPVIDTTHLSVAEAADALATASDMVRTLAQQL